MEPSPTSAAVKVAAPQIPAATICGFHSSRSASASGISTSRGMIFGNGRSRQRQKRGAVGQVIRAMTERSPSRVTVTVWCSAGESGMSHSAQLPVGARSWQRCRALVWRPAATTAVTRSARPSTSRLASVAMAMAGSVRWTVTASSAGSRASMPATERARQEGPPALLLAPTRFALGWASPLMGSN